MTISHFWPLAFLFSRFLAGTPSCLPLCSKVGIRYAALHRISLLSDVLLLGLFYFSDWELVVYGSVVGENLLI